VSQIFLQSNERNPISMAAPMLSLSARRKFGWLDQTNDQDRKAMHPHRCEMYPPVIAPPDHDERPHERSRMLPMPPIKAAIKVLSRQDT